MKGTVKWFNDIKGYGFIEGEDGKDYFVHHSSIEGLPYLSEGNPVVFNPVQGQKGMKAEEVLMK